MRMKNIITLLTLFLLAVACQPGRDSESDYVDFLYQHMALPDSTDYPRQYYEQQVAQALQARRELPWGSSVPEREFRHFVLPPRVNNETLDSFRTTCYGELKERVSGLTMAEAILEVNHWCHEHATYRPSDARTSSPLATMRTAYGRCGEESVLLVAALRTLCIPARQVYTPRWAHTDDNHAWVEAWADGQWHFLGACEPEPVLDLGWFNQSASRGMLMHTKVAGNYDGPEEVMSRTGCYTEINVIDHYAPTALLNVVVRDAQGAPVQGAMVEFKLYNYAEFYTVATKTTDAQGRASLSAGHGDMLVWVSKDGLTSIEKVTFDKDKEVSVLFPGQELPPDLDLDMVPPPVSASLPAVSSGQRATNDRRLAAEDSLRQAYEATMPVEQWRGNYPTLQQFLSEAADSALARRLLAVLTAKDLRDVELSVLRDNLQAAARQAAQQQNADQQLYDRYVLCPRVENEWLTPYKAVLGHELQHIGTPQQLEQWCADSLRIAEGRNPQHLPMRPLSTLRHRTTDRQGRAIFFVSAARSLGFPARVNEVDGRTQYYSEGQWHEATFGEQPTDRPAAATARLRLSYLQAAQCPDPKYYIHFTLSRLKDGRTQLLTYPEEATWQSHFAQGITLEAGEYVLTTGTRMASGRVLAHMQRFTLSADTTVTFTLRESREDVQVIGSLNAENLYHDLAADADKTLLSTTGRGYYVVAIVAPSHEPTSHALRDIAACREAFEQWGRKMVLLLPDGASARRFNFGEFQGLPSTVAWGTDIDARIISEAQQELHLGTASLPLFIIADSFNRVVYCHQGYTINLGEQLLKVIGQLDT